MACLYSIVLSESLFRATMCVVSTDRARLIAAAGMAGRAAEVGARNPHAGDGVVALSWDYGYRAMLAAKMLDSARF